MVFPFLTSGMLEIMGKILYKNSGHPVGIVTHSVKLCSGSKKYSYLMAGNGGIFCQNMADLDAKTSHVSCYYKYLLCLKMTRLSQHISPYLLITGRECQSACSWFCPG